jgi:hypothetical protein
LHRPLHPRISIIDRPPPAVFRSSSMTKASRYNESRNEAVRFGHVMELIGRKHERKA